MNKQTEDETRPGDYSAYPYCIFAVHSNDKNVYWYDHQYKIFFRGFYSAAEREVFWKTVVKKGSVARLHRNYELSRVDVKGRARIDCQIVGERRYADTPIIDLDVDHHRITFGLVDCTPEVG